VFPFFSTLPKKYDLTKVEVVPGYKVEPCENGNLCRLWNCRDFHSPMERRCRYGDDCADKENCNWIHVKAELIKKTLCIDAAEILGWMLKLIQLWMSHRSNAGRDDRSCFSPVIAACGCPTCNEHAKPMTPWQDIQRRPWAWCNERRPVLQSHCVEFWRHFLACNYPIIEASQNMSKYPTASRAFIANTNSDIFFFCNLQGAVLFWSSWCVQIWRGKWANTTSESLCMCLDSPVGCMWSTRMTWHTVSKICMLFLMSIGVLHTKPQFELVWSIISPWTVSLTCRLFWILLSNFMEVPRVPSSPTDHWQLSSVQSQGRT